jgi:hypothetical protein
VPKNAAVDDGYLLVHTDALVNDTTDAPQEIDALLKTNLS